jgi:hypothetical protein
MTAVAAWAADDLKNARTAAQQIAGDAAAKLVEKAKSSQGKQAVEGSSWQTRFGASVKDFLGRQAVGLVRDPHVPSATAIATDAASEVVNQLGAAGKDQLRASNLPFLRNLDAQYSVDSTGVHVGSVRTIDALYESPGKHNTFFSETGLARGDGRTTLNAGLGYRYLTEDQAWLLGINSFYDREWPYNHGRLSVGLEAIRPDFKVFTNRYFGLTDWRKTRVGYQERALNGWDVGVSGRVPWNHRLNLTTAGYVWPQYDGLGAIYGTRFEATYTPVSFLTLGVNASKDNQSDWVAGLLLRLNLNVAKIERELEAQSAADLNLSYVSRENRIRVQERQDPAHTGNVLESVGANTLILPDGTSTPLAVGSMIAFGSHIIVAATAGAYTELMFGDGGRLRIGTDSEVLLTAESVTLIHGALQFVSGATDIKINVPGGTVQLVGTDIDALSDGVISTVRVRDGLIRANELAASGGQIVSMAGSSAALLNISNPAFANHQQEIFNRLDVIDPSPLAIPKAAPYIHQPITVLQSPANLGDPILFLTRFSKPITLTGGVTLEIDLKGVSRSAVLQSGNGTSSLVFRYTTQLADVGATSVQVHGINLGGGQIAHGSLPAQTYAPQINLSLGTPVISSGTLYATISTSVASLTTLNPIPVNIIFNEPVTGFTQAGVLVNNGTISSFSTTDNLRFDLNITPQTDGLIDVRVLAGVAMAGGRTNIASNIVAVTYDGSAPSGQSIAFMAPVGLSNVTSASVRLTGGEVGASYSYSLSSSGGGTPLSGNGTISTATQDFGSLNLSGLGDGTLTVSLTLTDSAGNAAAAVTATTSKSTGYTVAFSSGLINNTNVTAGGLLLTGAPTGSSYNYSITSSGGGTPLSGSGTAGSSPFSISGLNLSGLNDGTLTVSLTTTANGYTAPAVSATVSKDAVVPTILSMNSPADATYDDL